MEEKAKQILEIKEKLKTALNNKGIVVGDKFSDYPTAVNSYVPENSEIITVVNPFESFGYTQDDYDNVIGNKIANQADVEWEYRSYDNGIIFSTSDKDSIYYPPVKDLSEYSVVYNLLDGTSNVEYIPKYNIRGADLDKCFNSLYIHEFAIENKPDSSPKSLIDSYKNLPFLSGDFGDLAFEVYEPLSSTGVYHGSKAGGSAIFNNIGILGSGISFGNITGMISSYYNHTESEHTFYNMQNVKSIGNIDLSIRYYGADYLFANSSIESIGNISISSNDGGSFNNLFGNSIIGTIKNISFDESSGDVFSGSTISEIESITCEGSINATFGRSATIKSIKSIVIEGNAPSLFQLATIGSIGDIVIEGDAPYLFQSATGNSWADPATIGDITVKGYVNNSLDYFMYSLDYIKSIGAIYMGDTMYINSGNKIALSKIQYIKSIEPKKKALDSNGTACLLYYSYVEKIGCIDIADENVDKTIIHIGHYAYIPCCTIKGIGCKESTTSYYFLWSYWGDATGFRNSPYCQWKSYLSAITTDEEARQSIVDSLLTYSKDRVAEGWATATIYVKTSTLNQLTEEEIEAINAKGYTLVGQ
jgi:hypothetical protein